MKATILIATAIALCSTVAVFGEVQVTTDHNDKEHASPAFKFEHVPAPSKNDAGSNARFRVIDGNGDENGGDITVLNDGALPTAEDEPNSNFFFAPGSNGGVIVADLKSVRELKEVNTYSWHPNSRGPQVFTLFASDGKAENFEARPAHGKDPTTCGWKQIAKVDTRKKGEAVGGQYGVSISDSKGSFGNFRYLLFAISQTEDDDAFGNTFYSEIDIVAKDDPTPIAAGSGDNSNFSFKVETADKKCQISIQLIGASPLQDWATNRLAPALSDWYPKIGAMLPSDGFTPPDHVTVIIKPGRGVAATGGTRITANSTWLKGEINKQAVGSLIHEAVHVVQSYGWGRRHNPDATQNPGWLVEGIADYIRFYKFEPQNHGADISRRGLERARYDGSYRVTANFLNWVSEKHDPEIVRKLNAAMREGKYAEAIWKDATGKSLEELGKDWKADLEKKIAPPAE